MLKPIGEVETVLIEKRRSLENFGDTMPRDMKLRLEAEVGILEWVTNASKYEYKY